MINSRRGAFRLKLSQLLLAVAFYNSLWRKMPSELLPWHAVHAQTQRWLEGGVFESLVHGLRVCLLKPFVSHVMASS